MKFLVTGASGMLGANLCRRLMEWNHSVCTLVRQPPLRHPFLDVANVEVQKGDITDGIAVQRACEGCDGVFHVAGYISYHPRDRAECQRVNVVGTQTVLDAAARAGVRRAVVTSSTAAVGIPLDSAPLDESSPFDPRFEANPYMATKRTAEQIALAHRGLEVVAVNPSTIFGAGDVKMNTGDLFRRLATGRLRWIPPGGTAVVSVRDCVEGHWLAWQKGEAGQRYILSSENYPFAAILRSIAAALETPPPQTAIPAQLYPAAYAAAWMYDKTVGRFIPGKFSRFVVDIAFRRRYFQSTRAQDELGWRPQVSLDAMMAEAAKFYQEQGLLRG